MQTFKTEKGRQGVSYKGFCYRFAKRGADGSLQWRCVHSDYCSGRLRTEEDYSDPVETGKGHSLKCLPDVNVTAVRQVRTSLRERAASEITPLPTIYREETAVLANQPAAAAIMPVFASVSSSMYRDRQAVYPPLPDDTASIILPREFRRTLSGHKFVVAVGANKEFFAFGTTANLKMLCDATEISMDGTFGTAPRLFRQLFTVNAFVGDRLLPAIYVLMTEKTTASYITVFQALKARCLAKGYNWDPQSIISDFESGLIPAVSQEFPAARHKGCLFHFCQVSLRHMLF